MTVQDSDKVEDETYRVKTVNLGANTKKTTYVRAPSRREAEQYVRELYNRHIVESALPRPAPDDVDVLEVGVSA